jgi:hypothetical protein
VTVPYRTLPNRTETLLSKIPIHLKVTLFTYRDTQRYIEKDFSSCTPVRVGLQLEKSLLFKINFPPGPGYNWENFTENYAFQLDKSAKDRVEKCHLPPGPLYGSTSIQFQFSFVKTLKIELVNLILENLPLSEF